MNCTYLLATIEHMDRDDPERIEIVRNCIDDGPTIIFMLLLLVITFFVNIIA